MELHQFERLKIEIATRASTAQILEIEDVVRRVVGRQMAEVALVHRTQAVVEGRACPRCASWNVVKHGKDENGRQRFMCRGCRRTYNILTSTPMARARRNGASISAI
jgi:transposase-like protein